MYTYIHILSIKLVVKRTKRAVRQARRSHCARALIPSSARIWRAAARPRPATTRSKRTEKLPPGPVKGKEFYMNLYV